jgi:hypothetical protein
MSTVIASSFTVAPNAALVAFTVLAALACCAGVVTALKGHWVWLIAGMFTGLTFFYSAFLPAMPDSAWARASARRARLP